MRLREFAGAVNRAKEVVVPVRFHADNEEAIVWVSIPKTEIKGAVLECAEEFGIEEVHAFEEGGTLYIDPEAEGAAGPGEGGEEEPGEEEPEEEGAEEEEDPSEEEETPPQTGVM